MNAMSSKDALTMIRAPAKGPPYVTAQTLGKLEKLLERFPETWSHTNEQVSAGRVFRTFHHVEYRTRGERSVRVRLASHVSSDMAELLVTLKQLAPELIAAARELNAISELVKTPRKARKPSDFKR